MKLLSAMALLLATGSALAAGHSVGISGDKLHYYGVIAGKGLNLYTTSTAGVELAPGSPYVLEKKDSAGNAYLPTLVAMNPAQDFAYVEYVATGLPIIVGFKITAHGLEKQWEIEPTIAGNNFVNSITAGANYVLVYSEPSGLWAEVIDQSGHDVFVDGTANPDDRLVALNVAPGEYFYFDCRVTNGVRSVSVYGTRPKDLGEAAFLVTSTDPAYFQSQCEN
jgi:hypothetical protein